MKVELMLGCDGRVDARLLMLSCEGRYNAGTECLCMCLHLEIKNKS